MDKEPLNDNLDGDEEGEEEEEEEQMDQATLDANLIKAAKENDIENVHFFLSKHATPTAADDNKWTPLLWAANNGNEEIVRLLLKHNAAVPYNDAGQEEMQAEGQQPGLQSTGAVGGGDEPYDPFVKPPVAS